MENSITVNTEKMHSSLCEYLHNDLWLPKNRDYGDSFHKLYTELGIISAVTQIVHKCNRIKTLARLYEKSESNEVTEESIRDTLLDMANYCIMTVMEIDREEGK